MDWLTDGVVVVTGAGGGIGRSIAHAFAKAGCNLVVADIELDAAKAVAAEIADLGRRAIAEAVDVRSYSEISALAERTYAEFGKSTVLVNNAGVTMRPFRALWDTSEADFQWMMDVNYWGVVNGVRAFVPRMLGAPGRRHIINTASMAVLSEVPGHGAYTAAKSAVDGMSGVLRRELAEEDIGVTVLYPGYIATRISTSERLRPETDRSENRTVKPYSDYVETRAARRGSAVDRNPVTGGEAAADHAIVEPIDVATVGPMVLEAVLANRPYCMTHPSPERAINRRAQQLKDAYHPALK